MNTYFGIMNRFRIAFTRTEQKGFDDTCADANICYVAPSEDHALMLFLRENPDYYGEVEEIVRDEITQYLNYNQLDESHKVLFSADNADNADNADSSNLVSTPKEHVYLYGSSCYITAPHKYAAALTYAVIINGYKLAKRLPLATFAESQAEFIREFELVPTGTKVIEYQEPPPMFDDNVTIDTA